jgi:hypothetical protein
MAITAAQLRATQASCLSPFSTIPTASSHPLLTVDQFVPRGQKKDTADVESRASTATNIFALELLDILGSTSYPLRLHW